jgi:hypothetical protein
MWALSLRTARRDNQNTISTLESYHGVMKNKLHVSKQQMRGREIAWLFYNLVRVVLRAYQHDALLKNVRPGLSGGVSRAFSSSDVGSTIMNNCVMFSTVRHEEE